MVKELKKPHKSPTNTINSILPENKTISKSRQQIYSENYQKNKEIKKAQRRERYAKQKAQEQLLAQKHYQANSIKVLLTLKEYTELNREKMKLWCDFMWTIQDCQKTGFFEIIQIQKLEQLAGELFRDYYQTAKSKSKSSWNSLSEEQQSKLIKYWSNEKLRKEQELTEKLTVWENQAKEYEKELELAKFHEERGKIKCECWQCAKQKEVQAEIKEKLFDDHEKKEESKQEKITGECANCYEYKKIDKESGLCSKCSKE